MDRPHVYGDEAAFRKALRRYITSGETLLAQADGAQRRIDAMSDEPQSRMARYAIGEGWEKEFRRWFDIAHVGTGKFLQDQFDELMPVLSSGLPPETGKPRHVIHLPEGQEWLRKTVEELKEALDAVGPVAAASRQERTASIARESVSPMRSRMSGRVEGLVIAVVGALIAAFVAYKLGWV
jgi:hypothetical protein